MAILALLMPALDSFACHADVIGSTLLHVNRAGLTRRLQQFKG